MTAFEDVEGAEESVPLYIKAEGKRSRGASPFTIRIYETVLDAGEEGITAAEIHDRFKDDPSFRTDTAQWWEGMIRSNPDYSLSSFDVEDAGLARVRRRTQDMLAAGYVRSDGVHPRQGGPRYSAGEPPKGYRPKYRRQAPHGWYPIDVKAQRRAAEEQRDRMVWVQKAKVELAKHPKAAKLRPLVEEALRLLEARNE